MSSRILTGVHLCIPLHSTVLNQWGHSADGYASMTIDKRNLAAQDAVKTMQERLALLRRMEESVGKGLFQA